MIPAEGRHRQELAEAVRAAARGQAVLSPPVAAKLVSRMRGAEARTLTSREIDVLDLVARGLTTGQIGRALLIARRRSRHICSSLSPNSVSTTGRRR